MSLVAIPPRFKHGLMIDYISKGSRSISVDIQVRFAETDKMGVVHHSAYVVWFEIGRVAWMEAVDTPYTEVVTSGHNFAVTSVHAEYRTSATFGDVVRLETRLATLRSRQVAFTYETYNAKTEQLLATGHSEHICVDGDGRMARIPGEILRRLERGAARLTDV